MKQLCVISCPILTASGYGARSRDLVKALLIAKKDEWDIKVLPQRWGATEWKKPEGDYAWIGPLLINQLDRQPDVWMQVTIPNEFQAVGKFNIGFTAGIETTICDLSWVEGINRMNLTLVSSNHAKEVFEKAQFQQQDPRTGQVVRTVKLEKPVDVLFEGIDLDLYKYLPDEDLGDTKLMHTLDDLDTDFAFLFVGHWLQGDFAEDRKNVGQMIHTFLNTFKGKKKKPSLILKTSQGSPSIMDKHEILKRISAITESIGSKDLPDVYLIHGEFSDEDINDLYNHPKVKAMLYMGKGEGYGRPLAEFTQTKKPVIASGWSGHLDFLSPEFTVLLPGELKPIHHSAVVQNMLIPESQWFSVSVPHASSAMKDVYENYNKYTDKGKRLAYYVKTNFSFEAMTDILAKQLEVVPKQVQLKLPQLKRIELPKLNKI
jgi:glycosyltransferase involved in cell wall biosynthesis